MSLKNHPIDRLKLNFLNEIQIRQLLFAVIITYWTFGFVLLQTSNVNICKLYVLQCTNVRQKMHQFCIDLRINSCDALTLVASANILQEGCCNMSITLKWG